VDSIIIVVTTSVVAINFLMVLILPWLMAMSFCYYFGPSKNVAVWILLHVILDKYDPDYCVVFCFNYELFEVIQFVPLFSVFTVASRCKEWNSIFAWWGLIWLIN